LHDGGWAAQIVGLHEKARKHFAAQMVDPVAHAVSYYEAMAAQAEANQARADYLSNELTEAFRAGPERLVSTPGYGERQPFTEAWAVLQDMFASEQGDDILRDVTKLIGERLVVGDALAVSIVKRVCDAHAGYHSGDSV
jgi:hypothetical protein